MVLNSLITSPDPLWDVLVRFLITLVVLFVVIRMIYYRYSRKEANLFSFYLMGIMVFLICILLKTVEIQLGMALGLFAVFAILRFRSRNINMRDMTYFFTVLGISVINAMANFYNPLRGTIIINLSIMLSVLTLEYFFHTKKEPLSSNRLYYDRLELLSPERKNDLLADISVRTGIKIEKARIRNIDLIKGQAELEIFYKDSKKPRD
jgi:uncharacterized membrane protein